MSGQWSILNELKKYSMPCVQSEYAYIDYSSVYVFMAM